MQAHWDLYYWPNPLATTGDTTNQVAVSTLSRMRRTHRCLYSGHHPHTDYCEFVKKFSILFSL